MPEVDSYKFSHVELLELMVKSANIHDGKWMLQVHFNITVANIGPEESAVSPGAVVAVQQIGIIKAKDDAPKSLVIDAAIVNPLSTT
ncbi:MAG: hypothetical protein V4747_11315 [Pseudomonadota bacterium]